jgi:GH35 family endo-1,4-beta-xylanase
MDWTILLMVYFCVMTDMIVEGENPIGLRVSSNLRGILLGTAADVDKLRNYIDNDEYNSNIKKNYQLIVPESELKPIHLWWGDNIYNWTDPDWLVGGTENSTGWVQQNGLQLRGHNLVWAKDKRIPE